MHIATHERNAAPIDVCIFNARTIQTLGPQIRASVVSPAIIGNAGVNRRGDRACDRFPSSFNFPLTSTTIECEFAGRISMVPLFVPRVVCDYPWDCQAPCRDARQIGANVIEAINGAITYHTRNALLSLRHTAHSESPLRYPKRRQQERGEPLPNHHGRADYRDHTKAGRVDFDHDGDFPNTLLMFAP